MLYYNRVNCVTYPDLGRTTTVKFNRDIIKLCPQLFGIGCEREQMYYFVSYVVKNTTSKIHRNLLISKYFIK